MIFLGTWPDFMKLAIEQIEANSKDIGYDISPVYRRVTDTEIKDSDFYSHIENGRRAKTDGSDYKFYACSVFQGMQGLLVCQEANPKLLERYPLLAEGTVIKDSGKIDDDKEVHINWYIYKEYKNIIKTNFKIK